VKTHTYVSVALISAQSRAHIPSSLDIKRAVKYRPRIILNRCIKLFRDTFLLSESAQRSCALCFAVHVQQLVFSLLRTPSVSMYIRYWLPRVNLFIKLHAASACELRWKKTRKRILWRDFIRVRLSHRPPDTHHKKIHIVTRVAT